MSECTTSVSAALHTLGRWTFAFTAIFTAMSTSAPASTYTWQLPAAAYITGTVACSLSASFSPSPPRGMTRSTSPSADAIWRSSSRSPPAHQRDRARAAGPRASTASIATPASAAFECAAIEEPRSTIALPDLMQSAEQSIVTFGRAS